ncbi:MAG: UDP-glucose--hexose-1-phosphate uridylyltransferase [Acidobacteria bacterium]|nr:UDP-glucose--hexose-1-phosphate uridylyltransferase [Acidobacteriota bacterium]
MELRSSPHRRFNPLTREWVLVSPHRAERPWQGQVETPEQESLPTYDPACYLCPGNARAGGHQNPSYTSTFVFENDFAALKPDVPEAHFDLEGKGLLRAESEAGICRVVCFSPRHDLTLARMEVAQIRSVVDVWSEQSLELGKRPGIRHVQIFENRGAMMGCSNPHPHGQIWANATIPNEPRKELLAFGEYRQNHGGCLLCDYLALELKSRERLVCENQHFAALVPFWAVWPFEVLLLSKRHVAEMPALQEAERGALAEILKEITTRYDNLFKVSFPYSMGFHQQPADKAPHPEWHFHAHYYPPLLRSATIRKFMVGYEMLASPQRDITPEAAAERLRLLPEVHYLSS